MLVGQSSQCQGSGQALYTWSVDEVRHPIPSQRVKVPTGRLQMSRIADKHPAADGGSGLVYTIV